MLALLPAAALAAGPVFLGADAGALVPLAGFGPGGLVDVDATVRLPYAGGRLLPGVALGYAVQGDGGTVDDPRAGATWDWRVSDQQVRLAPGIDVRAMPGDRPLSAFFGVAADVVMAHTVEYVSDEARAREDALRLGAEADFGVIARLGGGEVVGRAGLRFVGVRQALLGDHLDGALIAGVGYRRAL
jgi:hypothetical protein